MESKSPPSKPMLQQVVSSSQPKKLQLVVTGYEIRLDSSFTPFAVRIIVNFSRGTLGIPSARFLLGLRKSQLMLIDVILGDVGNLLTLCMGTINDRPT